MKKLFLIILLFLSTAYPQGHFSLLTDGDDITYSAEATQYFNRLPVSIPNDTLAFIAAFIDSMDGRGYWDRVDEMWLLANKTSANGLIGMKGLANATTNGTITFTAYRGFVSDGSSGYINTQVNPSNLTNFEINSCTFGVYSRTDNQAAVTDMGVSDGTNYTALQIRRATNLIRSWANQGVATTSLANTTSLGFFTTSRSTSNTWFNARNGSNLTGGTQASTAIPNYQFFICSLNASDTPSTFTTRQYALAMIGGLFSLPEQVIIYGFIETLLDHLGAGVIP